MRKYLNLRANIALGLIFAFLLNTFGPICPVSWSQEQVVPTDIVLPAPGQMVALSPVFSPAVLKGIKLDPKNPFRFHFFVDKGDSGLSKKDLKEESSKLIKYFLASLTIPEKDLWVNLSPYEKNRIVPQEFGQTEMGRDLLAEDYLLKQITASLIYPESQLGKEFWQKVYAEAQAKYGTTNIPINTFNKVWIVPDKAVVYENGGVAFVLENHLKVMLEQDYLSLQKHANVGTGSKPAQIRDGLEPSPTITNQIGSQIVREIVIPALTKEVNEGKNFSQLRQVFYSLILATWYKKKIKDSILNKVYSNRNKIGGVNVSALDKDRIYQEYLRAFKKGVFNYIKEDAISTSGLPGKEQGISPKKYFSGGMLLTIHMLIRQLNREILDHLAKYSMIDEDVSFSFNQLIGGATNLSRIKQSADGAMIFKRPQRIENREYTKKILKKGDRIENRMELLRYFFDLNKASDESFSPGFMINSMYLDNRPFREWPRILRAKTREMLERHRRSFIGYKSYKDMPKDMRTSVEKAQKILQDNFPKMFSKLFTGDLRKSVVFNDKFTMSHADNVFQKTVLGNNIIECNENRLVRVIIHETLHLKSNSDNVLIMLGFESTLEGMIEYFTQKMMSSESAASQNIYYDPEDESRIYGKWFTPYFREIFIEAVGSEHPVFDFYSSGNLNQFARALRAAIGESPRAIQAFVRKHGTKNRLTVSGVHNILEAFKYIAKFKSGARDWNFLEHQGLEGSPAMRVVTADAAMNAEKDRLDKLLWEKYVQLEKEVITVFYSSLQGGSPFGGHLIGVAGNKLPVARVRLRDFVTMPLERTDENLTVALGALNILGELIAQIADPYKALSPNKQVSLSELVSIARVRMNTPYLPPPSLSWDLDHRLHLLAGLITFENGSNVEATMKRFEELNKSYQERLLEIKDIIGQIRTANAAINAKGAVVVNTLFVQNNGANPQYGQVILRKTASGLFVPVSQNEEDPWRNIDFEGVERELREKVVSDASISLAENKALSGKFGRILSTTSTFVYWIISALPVPKNKKEVTLVDFGSGPGIFILRAANVLGHIYPGIKFHLIGLEGDHNAFAESVFRDAMAREYQFIPSNVDVEFVEGDFSKTGPAILKNADIVYSFPSDFYQNEEGKNPWEITAETLRDYMVPGTAVVEYGSRLIAQSLQKEGVRFAEQRMMNPYNPKKSLFQIYHTFTGIAQLAEENAVTGVNSSSFAMSASQKHPSLSANAAMSHKKVDLVTGGVNNRLVSLLTSKSNADRDIALKVLRQFTNMDQVHHIVQEAFERQGLKISLIRGKDAPRNESEWHRVRIYDKRGSIVSSHESGMSFALVNGTIRIHAGLAEHLQSQRLGPMMYWWWRTERSVRAAYRGMPMSSTPEENKGTTREQVSALKKAGFDITAVANVFGIWSYKGRFPNSAMISLRTFVKRSLVLAGGVTVAAGLKTAITAAILPLKGNAGKMVTLSNNGHFDKTKKTKILIHGAYENNISESFKGMAEEATNKGENFVVYRYDQNSSSDDWVKDFIQGVERLKADQRADPKDIEYIPYSLGAVIFWEAVLKDKGLFKDVKVTQLSPAIGGALDAWKFNSITLQQALIDFGWPLLASNDDLRLTRALHPEGEVKIFKDPIVDNSLLDTVGRNNVRTFKGKVDHVVIPTNSPLLGQVREFDVEHEHIAESPDIIKAVFDHAMLNYGGIDLNPAQMSMQVKKEGEDFKFDFNGTEIDAAQITGATFTIRTMTPVTNLPLLLGLNQEAADKPKILAKA